MSSAYFPLNQQNQQNAQHFQNQKQAQDLFSSWSKNKQHLNTLGPLMRQLIQRGNVTGRDERAILDAAYSMALKLNPDLAQPKPNVNPRNTVVKNTKSNGSNKPHAVRAAIRNALKENRQPN